MIDICKLCGQKKELLKKSHIIPDFMYRRLYTDDHKLFRFAVKDYVEGNRKINMPSSGEYEGNILCKECDNITLAQYETYARTILYGGQVISSTSPEFVHCENQFGVKYTQINKIDYKKMKLFFLSVLWRAGISSRSFFKEIDLNEHEPIIRQMLIDGNPGAVDEYPTVTITYLNDQSIPGSLVAQPGRIPDTNGIRYVFIIDGMAYVYHMTKESQPQWVLDFSVTPKGEMKILHIPKGMGFNLILGYLGVQISK